MPQTGVPPHHATHCREDVQLGVEQTRTDTKRGVNSLRPVRVYPRQITDRHGYTPLHLRHKKKPDNDPACCAPVLQSLRTGRVRLSLRRCNRRGAWGPIDTRAETKGGTPGSSGVPCSACTVGERERIAVPPAVTHHVRVVRYRTRTAGAPFAVQKKPLGVSVTSPLGQFALLSVYCRVPVNPDA